MTLVCLSCPALVFPVALVFPRAFSFSFSFSLSLSLLFSLSVSLLSLLQVGKLFTRLQICHFSRCANKGNASHVSITWYEVFLGILRYRGNTFQARDAATGWHRGHIAYSARARRVHSVLSGQETWQGVAQSHVTHFVIVICILYDIFSILQTWVLQF